MEVQIGGDGDEGLVVELKEERVDPRGEVGRVVEKGVRGELGEVIGGVDHDGLDAFEGLSDM
ncbi:hypothetical protein Pyn_36921 [Prunus yedoensis var. nudiflora]|uniref:Uncharacterized protein n=1 Tax=Prunus yedoensis var. nudiflora TaxID=2094558 RepID=A0A314YBY1_PRUYE|nr:hypothetical protein Pyn_36921 [Prunus yedoensis var. nudiflora]